MVAICWGGAIPFPCRIYSAGRSDRKCSLRIDIESSLTTIDTSPGCCLHSIGLPIAAEGTLDWQQLSTLPCQLGTKNSFVKIITKRAFVV